MSKKNTTKILLKKFSKKMEMEEQQNYINLLKKLLEFDVKKRIDFDSALNHKFLNKFK